MNFSFFEINCVMQPFFDAMVFLNFKNILVCEKVEYFTTNNDKNDRFFEICNLQFFILE